MIPAIRGAGKSGWVKTLIDGFVEKGCKVVAFETKGYDFQTLTIPQDDPKAFECLRNFGRKPRSYKVCNMEPAFTSDEYSLARLFKLDVPDFTSLNYATQITLWTQFFGVKEMSPTGKQLQRVLKAGPGGKPPNKIKEMTNYILADVEQQKRERRKQGQGGNVSSGMLYQLDAKVRQNELGRGMPFNPVEELAQNDVLVLNTPFDSKNLSSMCVYISVVLNRIINDRNAYVKTNGKKGLLSDPIVVIVEEADSIIGSEDDNMAMHVLYSILARYRQIGLSLVLITQNPALVKAKFIRQCQYVAVTQVQSEEIRQLLRVRGVPRYMIDNKLARLEYKMTSPVKEWAVCSPEDATEPLTFFPIWPTTRLVKEGQGVS